MISSTRPSATDKATPASPANPSGTPEESNTQFDNILALETLAADVDAAQTSPLDALCGDGLGDARSGDADDGDDDSDDALAILASLLSAAAVPQPALAPGAAAAGNDDGKDSLDASGKGAPGMGDGASSLAALATADAARAALALDAKGTDPSANNTAPRTDAPTDSSAQSATRAAELMAHTLRHPTMAAPDRAGIPTSVRDPRWAEDFSTRVALMVRGGESSASLQLSPVDLGPMDVNVTVRDSQATIHFGAAQAETRALIEASIPRLREMLAAQGFNLMDASVSQGFARQSRQEAAPGFRGEGEPAELEVRATRAIHAAGLLDTYA